MQVSDVLGTGPETLPSQGVSPVTVGVDFLLSGNPLVVFDFSEIM